MSVKFPDVDLQAAEEQLVGASFDHEHAMRACLHRLPLRPFRSVHAEDLHLIFYAAAALFDRGEYDGATNRDRLMLDMAKAGYGDIAAWLDDDYALWSPWCAAPEYVDALLDALLGSYRLYDDHVRATKAYLEENPLAITPAVTDRYFAELGPALARLKNAQWQTSPSLARLQSTAAPPSVDWEAIGQRAKR